MTILDFIRKTTIDNCLLLGYYGGGNYGDELLLEILQNLFATQGVKNVSIAYQQPINFSTMHENFGYTVFNIRSKRALLLRTWRTKCIIVGGGGLWGVDMNLNTFIMSLYLFLSRRLLGKKIYLLGVGYYSSTTRLGHLAAWLASHAANVIFARDSESQQNFSKVGSERLYRDVDLAWYVKSISLTPYKQSAEKMLEKFAKDTTILVALRRGQAARQQPDFKRFTQLVEQAIRRNPGVNFLVVQLELPDRDTAGTIAMDNWLQHYQNVQVLAMPQNPLVLYAFFSIYRNKLALIGPQFHAIITAYLTHVPFLPIVYDNKVRSLLERLNIKIQNQVMIKDLQPQDLQQFIDDLKTGEWERHALPVAG